MMLRLFPHHVWRGCGAVAQRESHSAARDGILQWSGPAQRAVHQLDGLGGSRPLESETTPVPAAADGGGGGGDALMTEGGSTLWVHFPQVSKEATDAFKSHVTEFAVPAKGGDRQLASAVRKSLAKAPPHYADFATTHGATSEATSKQSAVHLQFVLHKSSQLCRMFATPDICLTQISPCLDIDDLFADLSNGVGPGSTAEVVLRVIEAVVEDNKHSASEMDNALGRLEETVLSSTVVPDGVLAELSVLRRTAVHHRRALLLQLSVIDAFERDAAAQSPETRTEALDRSDFLLAQITKSEMARLAYAKEGMKLVLELLESARDRSAFVTQEVSAKNQQRANKLLALLTGLSGVLLPMQMAMYWVEGLNVGWLHW
jgi:hypothetical protein